MIKYSSTFLFSTISPNVVTNNIIIKNPTNGIINIVNHKDVLLGLVINDERAHYTHYPLHNHQKILDLLHNPLLSWIVRSPSFVMYGVLQPVTDIIISNVQHLKIKNVIRS